MFEQLNDQLLECGEVFNILKCHGQKIHLNGTPGILLKDHKLGLCEVFCPYLKMSLIYMTVELNGDL